jgi:serine protease Do
VVAAFLAGVGCREHPGGIDAAVVPGMKSEAARMQPAVPSSFVSIVSSARHGVVGIRSATKIKSGPAAMFPGAPESTADFALGTGFLIEARGVYILTNDHIAAGASELRVMLADRTEVPAKILGRDPRLDLALLSIDTPRLHPLPMGDSDQVQVGEWLVVLGNPFGDEVTAAAGVVSATGRDTGTGSIVEGRTMGYRTYVQTDARIHRGNSGGPVLDTAGQVIGVAVAPPDRTGELSFVIPINRVKEIVDALRDFGQVARGWLGVLVKPVTPELAQSVGLPAVAGALVTEVKAGSPAARSALRTGDIILRWGDHAIDHRSLPWIVAGTPIGRATEVVVWRNRAELKIPVITDKMPE